MCFSDKPLQPRVYLVLSLCALRTAVVEYFLDTYRFPQEFNLLFLEYCGGGCLRPMGDSQILGNINRRRSRDTRLTSRTMQKGFPSHSIHHGRHAVWQRGRQQYILLSFFFSKTHAHIVASSSPPSRPLAAHSLVSQFRCQASSSKLS